MQKLNLKIKKPEIAGIDKPIECELVRIKNLAIQGYYALMATEAVTGIDSIGRECIGTLLFVPYMDPEKLKKPCKGGDC